MPRPSYGALSEEISEEIAAITQEILDMKAKMSALNSIINRGLEIKWLAETYGLDEYAIEATRMVDSAVKKKKTLKENIRTYERTVEMLKLKLHRGR